MKSRFPRRHKFQISETSRFLAMQSLAQPREFNTFPSVWGRQVRWVKFTKGMSFVPISARDAKAAFEKGEVVHYIARGFPYSIKYSEFGREPSA